MICFICGKSEWRDRAGYGFIVRECDRCQREICEDCAEIDADGSSDGYRLTQWECPNQCAATEAETKAA